METEEDVDGKEERRDQVRAVLRESESFIDARSGGVAHVVAA